MSHHPNGHNDSDQHQRHHTAHGTHFDGHMHGQWQPKQIRTQNVLMYERNNVQTHSVSTAKQSDFMRRHRTKQKHRMGHTTSSSSSSSSHLTHRIFLVITIILFASLNEILICVAGDSTGVIRVTDNDGNTNNSNNNNQKSPDLPTTSDPTANSEDPIFNLEKVGTNLELSIAAVFNKVAYGTTTKRSISDVFVPSITTVPTPQLTTLR